MPRAFGRDRLAGARDGKLLLLCEESKGWRARSVATATSAEHPGTCVRWEGVLFEVEDYEPRAGGSVTYTLRPWDERHAIRVVATYSPETEAARAVEQADVSNRKGRHALYHLIAPLAGSLPAQVQERLESEYNVPAARLSFASVLPLWVFGWVCLILYGVQGFAGIAPSPVDVRARARIFPDWVLLFGIYLLAESTARLVVCVLQGRAIGTVAGTVLYEIWRLTRRGIDRVRGREVPPEKSFFEVEPADPRQEDADRFYLLEPVLSFLKSGEQDTLAERFGFDGLKWGRVSAIFLLVAVGPFAVSALLGFLIVPEASDLLLLAAAGGLSLEQVIRLRKVAAKQPAPSILGVLVRPAARRLLDRTRRE